jgi:hypothetical protein
MVIYSLILLLTLLFLIINYKKNDKKKIFKSYWSMDIRKSNWTRVNYYDFNSYYFYFENETVIFPIIDTDLPYSQDFNNSKGTWKLIKGNPDSIKFYGTNNPFAGTYEVKYYFDRKNKKNKNKVNKMVFSNDSTYIVCIKGWIDY